MKPIILSVLIFFGVTAMLAVLAMLFMAQGASDTTTDMTNDWSRYYEDVVSKSFSIPSEATILEASHTQTPIKGMTFLVVFTLPDNNTPEAALRRIALKSGFRPEDERSPLLWDCAEKCDLWQLKYEVENGSYHAKWGRD